MLSLRGGASALSVLFRSGCLTPGTTATFCEHFEDFKFRGRSHAVSELMNKKILYGVMHLEET